MSIPVTIQSVPITVTVQDQAPIVVTISNAGTSSGSSKYTGTAYLDFGSFPGSNTANVVVTGQTLILSTDIPSLTFDYGAFDTFSADEQQFLCSLIRLQYSDPTPGVGFTIYGYSNELIQGRVSVGWRY